MSLIFYIYAITGVFFWWRKVVLSQHHLPLFGFTGHLTPDDHVATSRQSQVFISAILEGTSACRRGVDEQYRSLSTDLSAETPASRTPETTSTRWPRINGSRIASKPTLFTFIILSIRIGVRDGGWGGLQPAPLRVLKLSIFWQLSSIIFGPLDLWFIFADET